jgi:hypothetical protein
LNTILKGILPSELIFEVFQYVICKPGYLFRYPLEKVIVSNGNSLGLHFHPNESSKDACWLALTKEKKVRWHIWIGRENLNRISVEEILKTDPTLSALEINSLIDCLTKSIQKTLTKVIMF